MPSLFRPLLCLFVGGALGAVPSAADNDGVPVRGEHRIGESSPVAPTLANGDRFASALCGLGDLDGDGLGDLAGGAPGDSSAGRGRGAVHILLLASDGTARAEVRIDAADPLLADALDDMDGFGSALVSPGDLDGDGVPDLAVGAPFDDDGGEGPLVNTGAVWILFLERGGSVREATKIGVGSGGFGGPLPAGSQFGSSLAAPGDFDGDGVVDLLVGAPAQAGGRGERGGLWLLLLQSDGTVKEARPIAREDGSLRSIANRGDRFASALALLGERNDDGFRLLAVGAPGAECDGRRSGCVWLLRLDANGVVRAEMRVDAARGFAGRLEAGDEFGCALAALGDVDRDGGCDLVVGAGGDDAGEVRSDRGAVWMVFFDRHEFVTNQKRLTTGRGGFKGRLDPFDRFGAALATLGDLDADGFPDVVVGADGDAETGLRKGAAWVLLLTDCVRAVSRARGKQNENEGRLVCDEPPRLGSKWLVDVDCSAHNSGRIAFGMSLDMSRLRTRAGLLLIDPRKGHLVFSMLAPHRGDIARFEIPVPDDTSFCGLLLFTQALIQGAPGPELTNALDVRIGR